jgi:hypothetical protein
LIGLALLQLTRFFVVLVLRNSSDVSTGLDLGAALEVELGNVVQSGRFYDSILLALTDKVTDEGFLMPRMARAQARKKAVSTAAERARRRHKNPAETDAVASYALASFQCMNGSSP